MWLSKLVGMATEFSEKVHDTNRRDYERYCLDRNNLFRLIFNREAAFHVPGSVLKFEWLRNRKGQRRGVLAVFLIPPDLYAGVSFCSPKEDFSRESGFYKATRFPGECRPFCRHARSGDVTPERRHCMTLACVHQQELVFPPHVGFQQKWSATRLESGDYGKLPVASFLDGVEWLQSGRRQPPWVQFGHKIPSDARLHLPSVVERMVTAIQRRLWRQKHQALPVLQEGAV